jgi:Brp/Blh family beta-carotene 15,15'-monooxygenase
VLGALLGYLLAAAGVITLWSVAPTACFVGFIALTWLHWGQGDLWFARRHPPDGDDWPRPARLSLVALRGALPMLAPLAWDPSAYRRIFEATTGLFGAPASWQAGWEVASQVGLFALIALLLVHLLLSRRVDRGTDRWLDLGDTLTLLALFAVVPAIFAVGLYFCAWHGPRHIVRLARLRSDRPGSSWGAVATTLRQSIPLTLVSIAGGLGVGLWVVSTSSANTPVDWFGWYLVLISGLTLPHVAVVFCMDQAESLWFGGGIGP